MSIQNHLTIILGKTAAARARLNQIDDLVDETDRQIKENLLSPTQMAQLDTSYENLSPELDSENWDGSISAIEGVLGI